MELLKPVSWKHHGVQFLLPLLGTAWLLSRAGDARCPCQAQQDTAHRQGSGKILLWFKWCGL